MPRLVDHDTRRRELAGALWRVVRRDGIAHVSVRTVAAEAGTSPSALRHYFATQDELLGFALTAMVERVRDRVLPLLPELRGRAGAARLLAEMLPLDPERRDEVAVYLAFLNSGGSDRRLRDDADAQTRAAVRHAVALLAEDGELGPGRDVEAETDRLHPLLDGLALHGVLWPGSRPPAVLRAILDAHLDDLRHPAPTDPAPTDPAPTDPAPRVRRPGDPRGMAG